ncbi:MAG: tripartite tricarboxylate transporter TctB family protein [Desulfovibrio sp.]|nr:tripartite tricarboxylate transporter TctB family protein [Desulfovibrio sp.]
MKYSDIGVIAIMYAVCAFFFSMAVKLPEEAQIYPLCLLAGLGGLNTLYLLRCLARLRRDGFVNDVPQIFNGFLRGQFFLVVLCCIAYMALMDAVGFYAASLAYLTGVMLLLRVPRLHLFCTVGVLALLIYAVFTLFLKVPLPAGRLFG